MTSCHSDTIRPMGGVLAVLIAMGALVDAVQKVPSVMGRLTCFSSHRSSSSGVKACCGAANPYRSGNRLQSKNARRKRRLRLATLEAPLAKNRPSAQRVVFPSTCSCPTAGNTETNAVAAAGSSTTHPETWRKNRFPALFRTLAACSIQLILEWSTTQGSIQPL